MKHATTKVYLTFLVVYAILGVLAVNYIVTNIDNLDVISKGVIQ